MKKKNPLAIAKPMKVKKVAVIGKKKKKKGEPTVKDYIKEGA